MTYSLMRLLELSGMSLSETSSEILSQDEIDDRDAAEDDARYEREKKIARIIAIAFKKIGIDLTYEDDAISYEGDTREASVKIGDSKISLDTLRKLQKTGLSNDFSIVSLNFDLMIEFKVSPELDHVVL